MLKAPSLSGIIFITKNCSNPYVEKTSGQCLKRLQLIKSAHFAESHEHIAGLMHYRSTICLSASSLTIIKMRMVNVSSEDPP